MPKQPPRHNKPWTKPEVKLLKNEADGNTPTRLIGLHLGRTPAAIRQKALEQGISLKPTNQSPYNRRKKP